MNRAMTALAITTCVLGMGLTGCSKTPTTVWTYSHSKSQAAERYHQIASLKAQGVQVFIQGESARVIVPTHMLFSGHSSQMQAAGHGLIKQVARLIKTYDVVAIKVSAFNDSPAWKGTIHNPAKVTTGHQAQAVASVLWSTGINMRMISAHGMSSQHPVASNKSPRGRADNRRVEISFRFYPHKATIYK